MSSQCDPSPRRAAVDTGSEEPGTPQQSPAISTGPVEPGTPPQSPAISTESPGASQAATQMEEEISPFESSMDGSLNQNFTSTEQESALLHQQDVGADDDEKENTTTTQQAAVREEFVSYTEERQGTTAWATKQHKLFDRGRPSAMQLIFLKRELFPCVLCIVCCCLFFPLVVFLSVLSIVFFPFCPQKLPKQV